jgi:hypothetical protein
MYVFYFFENFRMSFVEINKRNRAKLWQIFRFALLVSKKNKKLRHSAMGNESLRTVKIQHYENFDKTPTEMNKNAFITLLV